MRFIILLLIAQLLHGSGLRLNEAVRRRIKDLDFEGHHISPATVQKTVRKAARAAKISNHVTRIHSATPSPSI